MGDIWPLVNGLVGAIIGAAGVSLQSYFRKKGENLATKEDIGIITREIEQVRLQFSMNLENMTQRNRLQLAAIDKRLEAYQEAYRRTLKILDYLQEHEAYPEKPLFDDDKFRALENEAKEWLEGHYLYLGNKVGGKVAKAIGTLAERDLQAARRAIEKASGLPGWRF